jgi:mRNA-degrading endonuclease RelE of RelBE toxin-antitoxin system
MSWACSLSRAAAKALRSLPQDRQAQIARAIEEMGEDPTQGDVRPIKSGKLKGALRKRIGPYRIIYSVDPATRRVDIAAILVRSEATYR